MREHLDTMPIWEAYNENCECPLCQIRDRNEAQYVDNFLGGSVMEPTHRIEVNRHGFCGRHFDMMFRAGKRLPLALITDTYMVETMQKIDKEAEKAIAGAKAKAGAPLLKRLTGGGDGRVAEAGDAVEKLASDCLLCSRLNATMDRYVYTLIYMYEHEQPFRDAFAKSKGMCLTHYAQTLKTASAEMDAKHLAPFVETLAALMRDNLVRVEKDLNWFTQKFDYKNRDKPWGDSQDAVERAINKLRGKCVEG